MDLRRRGIVLCKRENEGADHLSNYCTADLCLCFCICKQSGFLMTQLKLSMGKKLISSVQVSQVAWPVIGQCCDFKLQTTHNFQIENTV